MSSMQAYLAAKYMSGAKADAILARSSDGGEKKKKKRKRKDDALTTTTTFGAIRVEEDGADGWGQPMGDEKDEDEGPGESWLDKKTRTTSCSGGGVASSQGNDESLTRLCFYPSLTSTVVETSRETFIPASKSNWSRVTTGNTPPPPTEEEEPEAADERPQIVATTEDAAPPPPKRRGGLRTAAELEAEELAAAAEEAANRVAEDDEEAQRQAQETIYRNASGKKVDLKRERAEERRRKKEADEREAKKLEWGKGLVQRADKEAAKRREEEERGRDIARWVFRYSAWHWRRELTSKTHLHRYAHDETLNRDLREVSRWNDPAANFLVCQLLLSLST